jgi:hypothetical protein
MSTPPKYILDAIGGSYDTSKFYWDPQRMALVDRFTGGTLGYGHLADPTLGTDVVTNLAGYNTNGPSDPSVLHFDEGVQPYTFFTPGGTHTVAKGSPEYNSLRDDARTRNWQGIAKVATVVGGGAALGGASGVGAGGGVGSGFAPGAGGVGGLGGLNWAQMGLRGAGLLGSSSMSGKGGGSGAGDASAIQSELAQRLLMQTDPLRTALIDRSAAYLGGGIDNSAQFNAFKASAEPQFAQARENIIADTPAGGQLTAALTQLQGGRAQALAQARGAIDEQELARAMTLGTGMTGQALGTLGNAANVQAMIAQSEADREAGMLGALGAGAGAYFGSKA